MGVTLTEFLVLAIAADDSLLDDALVYGGGGEVWTIQSHDRATAQVDAYRRIVDLHAIDCWVGTGPDGDDEYFCAGCMGTGTAGTPDGVVCPTLAALATVYADRPGYQDEWRRP